MPDDARLPDVTLTTGAPLSYNAPPARPTIIHRAGAIDQAATEGERALILAGAPIFQRGRRLYRPATQELGAARGRTTVAACFAELGQPGAVDALAQAATWMRYDARARKDVVVDPPGKVAEILLSRFGSWTFPSVVAIITTPTLRPDCSILAEPGYDKATRLYLARDPQLAVPAVPHSPTKDQAQRALKLLDSLLDNFPFVASADRSVALSALLTPVCRGAMTVAPLHAFRASTAGTGKSFLADVASAIATGRPCPVAAAGHNPDETDKRLVGLLLGGSPIVSIDNVNGELGSDLLNQAVERPLVKLRPLGRSEIIELEVRATFFATGNALRVRGDMVRRTLICDLDAKMERPELRRFAFDPVERVLADRGRYVAAALTIVRAFVVSGVTPIMDPLGSYTDYSATVRGALVWLDRADPATTMERAREDDPELTELREVVAQWEARIGVNQQRTAKALIEAASDPASAELREALATVAAGRSGIDTVRLGKWLRGRRDRIVTLRSGDGQARKLRIEGGGQTDGGVRWSLRRVG